MSRSIISGMKLKAVIMIGKKSKIERRIKRLQTELIEVTRMLDSYVKTIAEQEDKLNAASQQNA